MVRALSALLGIPTDVSRRAALGALSRHAAALVAGTMPAAYGNDAEPAVAPFASLRIRDDRVLADITDHVTHHQGDTIVRMKASGHAMLAATAAIAFQGLALPTTGSAHDQATFEVTIANVATDATLKLPDGRTTGAPIAPGMYAIVADGVELFAEGKPVGDSGLEHLAEDGNFEPLLAHIKGLPGVRQAGMFVPGQAFDVTARPGERLVFGTMFVQSNDLFFAPAPAGLTLFDASKRPVAGDRTAEVQLWDAGTEVNERPGAGSNQAPRQAAPNTGPAEDGVARMAGDGFAYPAVDEVINVTITAD
jgi:hypothetical protein